MNLGDVYYDIDKAEFFYSDGSRWVPYDMAVAAGMVYNPLTSVQLDDVELYDNGVVPSESVCKCEMRSLMMHGCKCGGK